MNFDVIGHEKAKLELEKITRPVLLTGPAHVGKRALALWLAAYSNCQRPDLQRVAPCGQCSSCQQFPNHPDLLLISPREMTKTGRQAREPIIPIAAISAAHDSDNEFEFHVIDWLETGPTYKNKFVIIDQAEKLNESAANALLKILEEPAKYARFILIAENSEQLLPTIASRLVKVELFPVKVLEKLFSKVDKELVEFAAGRPGILLEPNNAKKALKIAEKFLDNLDKLATALNESKKLADFADIRLLSQAINFKLRTKSKQNRLAADQALQKMENAFSKYVTGQLVFSVLAMELRKSLNLE